MSELVSLNIYETDKNGEETGIVFPVGAPASFAYKPIPAELYGLPQTGDTSSIAAWAAIGAACLAALCLRKKRSAIR